MATTSFVGGSVDVVKHLTSAELVSVIKSAEALTDMNVEEAYSAYMDRVELPAGRREFEELKWELE